MLNLRQIIHHFFRKEELEQVSESELRGFIQQYPYSTAGHLLLAKKLKDTGNKQAFEKEISSTALYFSNPVWLEWLITDGEKQDTLDYQEPHHNREKTNGAAVEHHTETPEVNNVSEIAPQPETSHSPVTEIVQNEEMDYEIIPFSATEEQLREAELPEDHISRADSINDVLEEERQEALSVQEPHIEIPAEEQTLFETNREEENVPGPELVDNEITEPVETDSQIFVEIEEQEIVVTEPVSEEVVSEPEPIGTDIIHAAETDSDAIVENENETPVSETSSEDPNNEFAENKIAATLAAESAPTNGDAGISFEPFHTIDYFASQGIKLRQEDFQKDRLGKQLKSFTEWLRSMKKVPGHLLPDQMDESAQQNIQRFAEHSVKEKEVLTEAMAEVWAKQGNRQKAIAVYNKLSLQNPDKSAYFAAKIDQLNAL